MKLRALSLAHPSTRCDRCGLRFTSTLGLVAHRHDGRCRAIDQFLNDFLVNVIDIEISFCMIERDNLLLQLYPDPYRLVSSLDDIGDLGRDFNV